MLFIVVFSGLVLGLVLGINYVLVYTIGVHATEWVLTAIMIGFWGWLILRPLVDIVVRRYKEFLNERDD
jgi:biotin transporter BioY